MATNLNNNVCISTGEQPAWQSQIIAQNAVDHINATKPSGILAVSYLSGWTELEVSI